MKTAKEFLEKYTETPFKYTKIIEAHIAEKKAIEFAKIHVTIVLKDLCKKDDYVKSIIEKYDIINLYPKENIK